MLICLIHWTDVSSSLPTMQTFIDLTSSLTNHRAVLNQSPCTLWSHLPIPTCTPSFFSTDTHLQSQFRKIEKCSGTCIWTVFSYCKYFYGATSRIYLLLGFWLPLGQHPAGGRGQLTVQLGAFCPCVRNLS